MDSFIRDGDRILFIGDSITDADRDRSDPEDLGSGYVKVVEQGIRGRRPEIRCDVLNRGIAGNRADHVLARWETDCIALKPTVITLLVGANDTWRRFDSGDPTSTEAYEESIRHMLARARTALGARFVLIAPFTLPVGYVTPEWAPDIQPRIEAVSRIARDFDAVLIPAAKLFVDWTEDHRPQDLLFDGVHPTQTGHTLLGRAWLDLVLAK